jgi:hypothetical protein
LENEARRRRWEKYRVQAAGLFTRELFNGQAGVFATQAFINLALIVFAESQVESAGGVGVDIDTVRLQ